MAVTVNVGVAGDKNQFHNELPGVERLLMRELRHVESALELTYDFRCHRAGLPFFIEPARD
jgi:hypothetical protein